MAQTSSAAREPSMEEILASIRRIIEDSDVSRHPAPGASAFPARGEVKEFRRAVPAQEATTAEPKAEDVEKKPAPARVFKEEPALREPVSEPAQAPAVVDEEEDVVLDAQNDDLHREDVAPVASVQVSGETQTVAETKAEARAAAQQDGAAMTDRDDLKTQDAGHILSEAAGRQVAAAFQDLNHAVHSGPRRSFDEIATDLLRPMLQDWLDQNLPDLVERLVREEIERVVRGEK